MADKIPVRVNYNGLNPDGLAEYQTGDTIPYEYLSKGIHWTYVQNTTPGSPAIGETWFQGSTEYTYIYKTSGWERFTLDHQLEDANETNFINAGAF